MAVLENIIYITPAQKYELETTGAIASKNHTADPNNIYLVNDESAWQSTSVSSGSGTSGNVTLYPGCFYQIYFRPSSSPAPFFNFAPMYIHYTSYDPNDSYVYTASCFYDNITGSDFGVLFLNCSRITINSDGTILAYFSLKYSSSNLTTPTTNAGGTIYFRRMNI